jgi:hypothetical protein
MIGENEATILCYELYFQKFEILSGDLPTGHLDTTYCMCVYCQNV